MNLRIVIAAALAAATAALALTVVPEPTFDPSRPVSEQAQYFRMKRSGKTPKRMKPEMRPSSWFYEQRAFPYAEIPQGAWENARKQANEQRQSFRQAGPPLVWEPAGPENIPGRIASIAVDPTNLNIIYAGTAAGGVYKSTDLGGSWTPIFDAVGTYAIGGIAINPQNTQEIYVGTGEPTVALDNYEGTGMYKSVDGGATWSSIGLSNTKLIGRVLVDPLRPDTVFVAALGKQFGSVASTDRGLYRSLDAGATWTQVLFVNSTTGCVDVAMHPGSGVMLAAMYDAYFNSTNAIWRSTNNGATWTNIMGTGGLPSGSFSRIGVTMDPQSQTCYATIMNGSYQLHGLYRSRDLGVTWTQVNDAAIANSFGGFGWYFGQVRVTPGDSDEVYSLGVTLHKSEDGGNSWTDITGTTHVDHHELVALPRRALPTVLYGGCDGGVNYSTDAGASWTTFTNMDNTQFYAMTIDPANPTNLYGGTQDNGTNRTLTGATNDWTRILGGDGFYCVVDYTNSNIIYAESQNGNINKSIDGGFSFFGATNGINGSETRAWNTPIVIDPKKPNKLYTSTDRVYRTVDGAANWSVISPDLSTSYITTIGVAKSDSNVVYAGSRSGTIYATTNGGGTWTQIDGALADRWVTRLTVDPTNAAVCYATLSGYIANNESLPRVYRTTNFGSTWSDISSNLPNAPVNDIIIDPHNLSTLYVGTDVGVYQSTNLGVSWSPLGTGLVVTCVHDLEMHPQTRTLVAATHGRSMWKTTVPCPDATDSDGDGIGNGCDNCPTTFNPDQTDLDGDGIGDLCDNCVDPDADGFGNPNAFPPTCPIDNCPTIYNPLQEDTDFDGIGDSCEFIASTTFDTITTPCLGLVVSNNAKIGTSGVANYSMDYALQGDCAASYLYEGSVAISKLVDVVGETGYTNMFSRSDFKIPSSGIPTLPAADSGDYFLFKSGTFVTKDGKIGLEKSWYAPKQIDSCHFMIQCLKLFPWEGAAVNNIAVGDAFDWDVPSASGSNNTGGFISGKRLIWQSGVGFGCQDNTFRFSGVQFLGSRLNNGAINTLAAPAGGVVEENPTYLYPESGFNDLELYNLMRQSGYSATGNTTDLFSLMTFDNNLTLAPTDTAYFYSAILTVRDSSLQSLVESADEVIAWFDNHIVSGVISCCVGTTGNVDCTGFVDIADLTTLVDHLFISNPPLCCPGEANVDGAGNVDIADLTFLVDHLFISNPPLPSCP